MSQSGPIRVFLAIEHPLVRRGLFSFIRDHEDLLVVGEAADGESALRGIERTQPHVTVVHANLPIHRGSDVVRALQRGSEPVHTIMLVPLHDRDLLRESMATPADAFLLTTDLPQHVVRTARMLMNGLSFTCPLLAACRDAILDDAVPKRVRNTLNQEELLLFSQLTRERNGPQIARELGISLTEVAYLRVRICEKLHHEAGGTAQFIHPREIFIPGDGERSSRAAS
ncbi:MAG: response regulator transcription factor [Bacteroidetes bacterium]|nr:response regulator transcription factor [Bacteroidota bacterium]